MILIGSSREQKLASLVCAYSVRKRSSIPNLAVTHTYDLKFPNGTRPDTRSRSGGFSFNRFGLPKISGYSGRGVYLECDQLIFGDVAELLALPFEGKTVLRPANQASVLVLDCASLTWDVEKIVRDLDAGEYTYEDLMQRLCIEPADRIACTIPPEWNHLEAYKPNWTKNLHYTNMPAQPWRKWGHPLRHLWIDVLKAAVADGTIPWATVQDEVKLGYVVRQVLEAVS
jgi:hypothetical protein